MCKFESSQKDESRWQSTDSSKAYRNTSAFKCTLEIISFYYFLFRLDIKFCEIRRIIKIFSEEPN